MTRLLVSVRTPDEASIALEAGVDLIDVKEPRTGSLGAAAPETVAEVVRLVANRVPVSAALGELVDFASPSADDLARVDYCKLGLAGCALRADWPQRWHRAWQAIPHTCGRIAVIYADWRSANSPSPEEILRRAPAAGCVGLLIDTFDKRGGDLFRHLDVEMLRRLGARAWDAGLFYVLAGGLRGASVRRARDLGPDYVAVRGAVCDGTREGPVQAGRVRQLVADFREWSAVVPNRAAPMAAKTYLR